MKPFGWILLAAGMLGIAFSSGAADQDHVRYLREQYAYLQSLPAARQEQLRDLDREFYSLDAETQKRLRKVMDRYNWWLAHLPEKDRKRVVEAATAEERLTVIVGIKDREWIDTLPKAYRDKYAAADKGERSRLVGLWRDEQRERREEWQFVRNNWDDIQNDRFSLVLQTAEFRQQLDAYMTNLDSQLSQSDRDRLRKARISMEDRAWFSYLKMLVDFSDRYVLLPGPADGPRNFDALPMKIKDTLIEKDKNAFGGAKKKPLPKDLQSKEGRWPDFAIAVTAYARQHVPPIVLPEQLGPANKAALPPEVHAFIDKELEPTLKKPENAKDLARLHEAEGKWPDYPRAVMELARQHKLFVPGWMMPGKPDVIEKFRIKKKF